MAARAACPAGGYRKCGRQGPDDERAGAGGSQRPGRSISAAMTTSVMAGSVVSGWQVSWLADCVASSARARPPRLPGAIRGMKGDDS